MAANAVEYASNSLASERLRMGRSNCIWARGAGGNFQVGRAYENNSIGSLLHEEFIPWAQQTISTTPFIGTYTSQNTSWKSSEGTTNQGSIVQLNTDIPVGVTGSLIPPGTGLAFGAIELASSANAHNECAMELGGLLTAKGQFGLPSSAAVTAPIQGQLPRLFYETRVRFPQATASSHFFGLAAPTKAAHNAMFSSSDVAVVVNAIGFWVVPVASTGFTTSAVQIQPGYMVAGAAATISNQTGFTGNVGGIPNTSAYPGTSGSTAFTSAVTSLSTDWTKLGFVVDPTDPAGVVLRFYQDGVQLAQQTIAQIVAANWPSDVPLNLLFYTQPTGGTAAKLDVDWVAAAQTLSME